MKKAPFFLYERNTGLICKVYDLKELFEGFLNRYEINNVGKNFTIHYFNDYNSSYKKEYKYIILDDYGNPVSQQELLIAFEDINSEMSNIDKLFDIPKIKRGLPISNTGINQKKRHKKRFRLKPIFCLNEIKQTCIQYRDDNEPKVKNKRKFYNYACWEDKYIWGDVVNKSWKKYRKHQYK